ncbi:MAG: acylphosphatase [Candidatus Diapherotrites archaeon]|uniref:Acylphosphatase n=1 Tax=Candidatus Iainarchaeum sp. TaxID=3101447 RepID=A0A938YXE2_9ARCH|nr:acylphosphatase [Candidatus Diapherotrites archaeon]
MLEIHAFVSGHVQGVNFRYYTQQHAKTLGLKGFVRNLVDGRVEVLAQGSKEGLEKMCQWLRLGPMSGYVSYANIEWGKARKKHKGFSIK